MRFKLNKSASFSVKNNFLVVYYNYGFYFFEKKTKKWLELVIFKKKGALPSDFIEYLKNKDIIYED